MTPPYVAKYLLSKRVYDAWFKAEAIDPEDFPDRREFQRLRHGRVTREVVCILAGVTYSTVAKYEKGRVRSVALVGSDSIRRLVSALQAIDAQVHPSGEGVSA